MAWDGSVSGALEFPKGGLTAWKKSSVDSSRVRWPGWIRPRALEGQSVASTLSILDGWNKTWRKFLHGGEIVEATLGTNDATFRGYFTCWWFPWAASCVAAVAATAAGWAARGEICFVDVATARGHLLELDGKGGVALRVLPTTLPSHVLETHEWLESRALLERVDFVIGEGESRAVRTRGSTPPAPGSRPRRVCLRRTGGLR